MIKTPPLLDVLPENPGRRDGGRDDAVASTAPPLSADGVEILASLEDASRFGVIFERHFDAIHRYLARRVGNAVADDLAAQTFVVGFESRRRFKATSTSARPWLYGIASNLIRNDRRAEDRWLRTQARLSHGQVGDSMSTDESEAGADRLDAAASVEQLVELLASMEATQRDVLLMYAWAELSYEEISASLGIPIGTVASRISRARRIIRAQLLGDTTAALPGTESELP